MKNILFLITLFSTFSALAAPFGLTKGMGLEELKKQGTFVPGNQQYVYTSKSINNGHPDFEAYSVVLTPEHGLCKIIAIGKDVETNGFGSELESKYKNLIEAMSGRYGPPGKNYDFLRAGSIWKESQYWMMGLLKKDRTLTAFWSKPENNNLPDALQSIMLDTVALSGSKGYLQLAYEFDNVDACIAFTKAKKNSNL